MKTHDIAALSAKILLSYYVDNDSAPFLNACHGDVVLVGPSARRQNCSPWHARNATTRSFKYTT